METTDKQNATLQTERIILNSPDIVYAAFSDPVSLAQWWGPQGFTNSFETFEFWAGGRWEFVMHGPDGHNYPNRSVFRELVFGEKLVIEHVSAPRFTLSVTLAPVADGTRIQWLQQFEDPNVADAVRHIAEPGNEQNLDRLQRHLCGEYR